MVGQYSIKWIYHHCLVNQHLHLFFLFRTILNSFSCPHLSGFNSKNSSSFLRPDEQWWGPLPKPELYACFSPRTTHRTDASPTWQCHSPEEQQPACDNCGHRRHPHRVGRGDRSCDLYPALFSPAEKVSSNRLHEEKNFLLRLYSWWLSLCFSIIHHAFLLLDPD